MLDPKIIEKPEFSVIGCRQAFIHALSPDANNLEVIGSLWCNSLARADGVPNRIGDEMFGVIYDRPESERSHPHELQYIAAVRVSSTAEIPPGMVSWTIPASTFAVFVHRGRIETIGATAHEIYRVWLPASPFEHAEIPDVELYDGRFRPGCEDSEMEYWVPVRLKSLPQAS